MNFLTLSVTVLELLILKRTSLSTILARSTHQSFIKTALSVSPLRTYFLIRSEKSNPIFPQNLLLNLIFILMAIKAHETLLRFSSLHCKKFSTIFLTTICLWISPIQCLFLTLFLKSLIYLLMHFSRFSLYMVHFIPFYNFWFNLAIFQASLILDANSILRFFI